MEITFIYLAILSLVASVISQNCLTVLKESLGFKKANVGKVCKFPFLHKEIWYNGCNEFPKRPGNHWCSTKVDKFGSHIKGNWGVCGEGCRIDGDIIEGDTACTGGKICMSRYQCPLFQKLLSIQNTKSQEFRTLLAELKKDICNNIHPQLKNKRICCENTAPTEPVTPSLVTLSAPASNDLPAACVEIKDGQTFSGSSLPRKGQCGVKCNRLAQVIGGDNVKLGEFPWAVLLGFRINKKVFDPAIQDWAMKRTLGWKCGGTLINSWYVLTAAHCVEGIKKKQLKKVKLGELIVGNDPDCPEHSTEGCLPSVQEYDVDQVIAHKKYTRSGDQKGVFFDIALIRMKTEAVLNRAVQFACLPVDESESAAMIRATNLGNDLIGMNATVIGWGQISNYDSGDFNILGVTEKHLQKLQIPVVSHEKCSQVYGNQGHHITQKQICAGGEVGKDSCRGDSGGGLFIQAHASTRGNSIRPYVQIGVVSYGTAFCGGGSPGVYTRVTEFMEWIQNNLKP